LEVGHEVEEGDLQEGRVFAHCLAWIFSILVTRGEEG
jgi:hypothetical protein